MRQWGLGKRNDCDGGTGYQTTRWRGWRREPFARQSVLRFPLDGVGILGFVPAQQTPGLGRRADRGRGGHGLHADQAQFLEPPVLQCADRQGHSGFPDPARRVRRDRRHIADPQRDADVAQSELQSRPATRPGERPPEPVARAEARLPPLEFGRDRRQSGPAPPGRRPASDRSFNRPRHWPSAIEPSSGDLCRRSVGAFVSAWPCPAARSAPWRRRYR